MKYILRNIVTFIKKDKVTFCMMQICAFLAGIMLCFSYGIFQNYQAEDLAWNGDYQLKITFEPGVTKGSLDACLWKLPNQVTDRVECFSVTAHPEENVEAECRFTLQEGHIAICRTFGDNLFKNQKADVYFTPELEREGAYAALAGTALGKTEGGTVTLQGKEYQVIGTQSWEEDSYLLPWASLADDTKLSEDGITLVFDTAYTEEQYREVDEVFSRKMGDTVHVPVLEKGEGSPKKFTGTMLLSAALMSAVIAVDFSLLYLYILEKRRRQYGIFMLCGMGKGRVLVMCVTECMLCVLPFFLAGILVFHMAMLPWMEGAYRYLSGIYAPDVYAALFLLFLAVSLLVCALMLAPGLLGASVREHLM